MKHRTNRVLTDEVLGFDKEGAEVHLKTEISYDKGGANYFNGRVDRRGYSLIVRIERHKDGCRSFDVFTGGLRAFLEEAKVFTPKRFEAIVPPPDKLANMLAQIRAKGMAEVVSPAIQNGPICPTCDAGDPTSILTIKDCDCGGPTHQVATS
jgi:hypothetical protein